MEKCVWKNKCFDYCRPAGKNCQGGEKILNGFAKTAFLRGAAMVLLTACMLMMQTACAHALSVRRADGVGGSVAVWTREKGKSYLFLPAYMQGQALLVSYDGERSVRLGGDVIADGGQTNAICADADLRMNVKGIERQIVVMQSGNIAAIHLTTQSGKLDYIHKRKGNRESGAMQIVTAEGIVDCDVPLEYIKGHGNATFTYEKKPYQIKLEKKASLLGMEAGKRYVLLANQHENSLLRNRITLDLARGLGLRFTSECRPADLYVNGEYRGSYLLCDKVDVGAGSVEITSGDDALEWVNEAYLERGGEPEKFGRSDYEPGRYKGVRWPKEPEDLTGGYLFELEYRDRYEDETSGLVTERGQAVVVKSPGEMGMAQGRYAYELLNSFERAIFAPDGTDSETGKHYTQIADRESLVRKYMIEEASKNYDGNNSSQYFYKDSDQADPLLYAGPVWDYDSAWGNYAKKGAEKEAEPQALRIAKEGYRYSWWPALYAQEDFAARVREVYGSELRPMLEVLTGACEPWEGCAVRPLEEYADELAASAEMNFARWRIFNSPSRAIQTGEDYEENIAYLRAWIEARAAFLDSAW